MRFYGYALTGGNNALPIAAGPITGLFQAFGGGLATVGSPIYYDFLMPWITYHYEGRLPAGANPEHLSLIAVSGDGSIEELRDVVVDTTAKTVAGSITHFTRFYAFIKGPVVGGPSIQIGGPTLAPLFGVGSAGVPANVDIWLGPDGQVRTDPYSDVSTDTLVIQVQSDQAGPGAAMGVEMWVTDPVDPGGVVNELGERISTTGWWHDTFFGGNFRVSLMSNPYDADGTLIHAISGQQLQSLILQHPAGYSSGRMHLRFTSLVDPTRFVDAHISFGKSPYL